MVKNIVKQKVVEAMAASLEGNHWDVRYSEVCSECKEPSLPEDIFCSQCGYELDEVVRKLKTTHLWDAFISGLDEWEEK